MGKPARNDITSRAAQTCSVQRIAKLCGSPQSSSIFPLIKSQTRTSLHGNPNTRPAVTLGAKSFCWSRTCTRVHVRIRYPIQWGLNRVQDAASLHAPRRQFGTGTEGQTTPRDNGRDRSENPLTTPHSENENNCTNLPDYRFVVSHAGNAIIFTETDGSAWYFTPEFQRGTKINPHHRHGAQFRAYQLGGTVLCSVF